MNQAIARAEVDYGSRDVWYRFISDPAQRLLWIKKYIVPYMNVSEIEENINFSVFGTTPYIIHLADGSSFTNLPYGQFSDWLFFPGDAKKCASGKVHYRQFTGVCAFAFYYRPAIDNELVTATTRSWTFEPYMYNYSGVYTEHNLKYDRNYGCYSEGSSWHAYCTRLIQYNGWKIPDDYPFRVKY